VTEPQHIGGLTAEMLDRLRRDVAKLDELVATPDPFPGDRTLALLNMTSYLGDYVKPLLATLDSHTATAIKEERERVLNEFEQLLKDSDGAVHIIGNRGYGWEIREQIEGRMVDRGDGETLAEALAATNQSGAE